VLWRSRPRRPPRERLAWSSPVPGPSRDEPVGAYLEESFVGLHNGAEGIVRAAVAHTPVIGPHPGHQRCLAKPPR
jgi:hypothetical protein